MSSSGLLSVGTRAMFASYAALQTTGHNIANANTTGYSRQRVELETAGSQYSGSGFIGKGVNVASVTRAHDAFLTREAQLTGSLASMDQTRYDRLQQLEKVFDTGESGIGYAANQIFNSMVDVASSPADLSARQVVLSQAENFASKLRSAGGQLDALQSGTTEELRISVAKVNELAGKIANLNKLIASQQGSGQSPNDLLDQRDQMIAEIGQYIQVTTIPADDGSMGLFIAGGQRLVLGSSAETLALMPDAYDASKAAVGLVEGNSTRMLDADAMVGGSMAGLLRFQNEDLTDARNSIGQIAAAVAGALNQQQSLGLDIRSTPGSGAPILSAGAPQVLPANSNVRNAGGNFAATVSLTVVDASQLQASDYELVADPAGTAGAYQLTRLSDGLVRTVSSGDTIDGMTIAIGTPAPAASDRFLLQPVARAASGMQRVLSDPRGIAAASPVAGTAASTNTGTASIGGLRAVDASINPGLTASIAFTSGTGAYNWTLRDSSNAVVSSGSATWQAGQPIVLNGFELNLDGVPASGDSFTVVRTAYPGTNNGNALAMADLGSATIVGGQRVTDAYASALADVGVRVQGAEASSTMSASVASDAKAALTSETGVNLDEEAARLLQYQQAYQAAAKILQVAQSVFDTLLQTAR